MNERKIEVKCKLFNDHFQNYKRYGIPKAQLVIADIPYNLGVNAYASNPQWYIDRDNQNGKSKLAGKSFFATDNNFNIAEYFHFCNNLLKPEPKEKGKAPAMIIFCAFEQIPLIQQYGLKHGFKNSYLLVFIKNYSSQVLKANMKIVGATEYAIVLYRDKLPKFNNGGRMIFNWFEYHKETRNTIHPTQKPLSIIRQLIEIFTDKYDVVIDPVAGSGSTLRAAWEMDRNGYGFEIDKKYYKLANEVMLSNMTKDLF